MVARAKEVDKVKSSMVKPEDLFKTEEFKERDEIDVPINMANEEAVSGGQMKNGRTGQYVFRFDGEEELSGGGIGFSTA